MKKYMNKKNIAFGAFIVTIICLRLFVIFPATVKGASMQPTLSDGQNVFALRTSDLTTNDIVVFESPIEKDAIYVKRVIGTPGDTIKIEKNDVFVNGRRLREDYLIAYDGDYDFTGMGRHVEMTVPEGEYFVMGDNRFNSTDSRMFGTIGKDKVRGKIIFGLGFSLY